MRDRLNKRGAALAGLMSGFLTLLLWVILDQLLGGSVWNDVSLFAVNIGPLVAGVTAGALYSDTVQSGASAGLLSGLLLTVLVSGALVLVGIFLPPSANPIDFTDPSPFGYVLFSGMIGVLLLPYFVLLGTVGGVVGAHFERNRTGTNTLRES